MFIFVASYIRDQPFNLKGGYGFLFRSEIFFLTTRELEYFFYRAMRDFSPQNSTLGYMTKTLNQIIFFSSTKIRIFFSATLGIRIFFWKKTIPPPFKLNGRSLSNVSYCSCHNSDPSELLHPLKNYTHLIINDRLM